MCFNRNLKIQMNCVWVLVIFVMVISIDNLVEGCLKSHNVVFRKEFIHSDDHTAATLSILQQVQNSQRMGELVTLQRVKGHSHCPRSVKYKEGTQKVDISALDRILSIDPVYDRDGVFSAVVEVEPLVTMEQLVKTLLPLGLMPAVVPEFRKITVGGAIQGLAAESSSFKFGFFHDICTSYELVLGSGEIITATAENEHSQLFKAIPGSYGSLAILTKAKVLCVRATEQVLVECKACESSSAFLDQCQLLECEQELKKTDFLEGVGFGPNQHVFISARFVHEQTTAPLKRLQGFLSPWFFKVVEKKIPTMLKDGSWAVCMPTEDYLFRHDRGAFWMASYKIPHIIGRLMGSLLDSRSMFQLADAFPFAFPKHQIMLQDFMLPKKNMPAFVEQLKEKLDLWPLWYLPMKNLQDENHILSIPKDLGDFCNVGAYGIPKKKYSFKKDNCYFEKILTAYGGRKVFYSHAFYSKSDFFNLLYNGPTYSYLRGKYQAESAFMNVFDKVITKGNEL